MTELVCVFSKPFFLTDADHRITELDEEEAAPGSYFIVSMASVLPTPDVPLAAAPRQVTAQYGTLRTKSFCKKIRERDRGCVLTGGVCVLGNFAAWDKASIPRW
ncbi:hypothetical protein B9Z19DRAFT_1133107 [Tuber borchii]|uniref:Uncharacterized protein n=1 Tax=Tuber borchii TaxID=42251 RepID=A0A2T6ZGD2_TUBBO|nr:hypothetical protein B9Z19DRAFT_1133107 [Tuber borchii]